jgi:hypothetical protein
MMGIVVPETCWASNKICNKSHLLHLVGILFPHINDNARSKPHQIQSYINNPLTRFRKSNWQKNSNVVFIKNIKKILKNWLHGRSTEASHMESGSKKWPRT